MDQQVIEEAAIDAAFDLHNPDITVETVLLYGPIGRVAESTIQEAIWWTLCPLWPVPSAEVMTILEQAIGVVKRVHQDGASEASRQDVENLENQLRHWKRVRNKVAWSKDGF